MNIIFAIVGGKTHRGIQTIYEEITKIEMKVVVVVGISNTIDNNIGVIDRSFGFESSIEQAAKGITSANIETNSVKSGILVKYLV